LAQAGFGNKWVGGATVAGGELAREDARAGRADHVKEWSPQIRE
jgi:hypothetical protein